jgi:hypothetical protein
MGARASSGPRRLDGNEVLMAEIVTIQRVGESLALVLPASDVARLGLREGDQMTLVRGPDGLKLLLSNANTERNGSGGRDHGA